MKPLRNNLYEKLLVQCKPQLTLVLMITLLFLVACNSENDTTAPEENSEPNTTETFTENTESTKPTNDETSTSFETPQQCITIKFEKDALINGNELAHCMMATMLAAKTGSHFAQTSTASTNVDFKFDPQYSMYVENEDMSIIIHENTGWLKQEGQWIEEDDTSEDMDVILATNTIKLTRVFSHPYMITQYLAAVSQWKVIDFGEVPDNKAFVKTAWQLVPEGPVNLEGMTLSDVELWITDEYLGAYYVSTGNIAGITETTSNTFTQWGEPITIPEPF
ncbi:hypothetical protein NSQ62_09085 [Solibacillus sp. FSL H8-0523]|uniref:hypothetical protein n=1 Tax=unclassified Solibacillus TaxID=2637870 RepID=UPI003100CA52